MVPGTAMPFVLAGFGLSVRAGAPKPDISTVEAYKAALLAAKSIGYSRGCSGTHVARRDRASSASPSPQAEDPVHRRRPGPATFFLARGDFELAIQQTNIMVGAPGTDYVGPVPGTLNKPCPNSVAMLTVSKQQDAARDDPIYDFRGGRAAASQGP